MTKLLTLKDIKRAYLSGESEVNVLKNINLEINKGEMVAIIGSSGSGKSTLMNILGLLDKPSSGTYLIEGKVTATLDSDSLSTLRREYFGFIFQRYHLLGSLTAIGNVEMPAIYANQKAEARFTRAKMLLTRLGLGSRIYHRPNQLSGGQQQRVSIARALMNDGQIILADEPTGALDKASGEEVLKILDELHQEGRTIIIVTHDPNVAKKAERIIEISDGEIIADYKNPNYNIVHHNKPQSLPKAKVTKIPGINLAPLKESLMMALLSLKANPMRSFLTMLGIVIGIASVILMVAFGNGTQSKIMKDINSMGTNSLTIYAGKSLSDTKAGWIVTLRDSDAEALRSLPYVAGVSPGLVGSVLVRYKDVNSSAHIVGASPDIFIVKKMELVKGSFFDNADLQNRALNVVIDETTTKELFGKNSNPIGKHILVSNAIATVIGEVKDPAIGPPDRGLTIYAPYKSVQTRLLGSNKIQSITVRVADNISSTVAEAGVSHVLTMRHGSKDFFIINSEDFRKRVEQITGSMTLLIAAVASISLLVGGIGVMNIMLVTVSERINEIGVRMAVGARQRDILRQFLIETIIVCIIGGSLGVFFAILIGELVNYANLPFKAVYTPTPMVVAFIFSSLIGICFGFLPSKRASQLNPVTALARE